MSSAFLICFACGMSYVNYRGLDFVSRLGFWLMLFVLGPFLIIVVLGLPQAKWGNFFIGADQFPTLANGVEEGRGAIALFNIMFWNLNNW